ncbi:chaoptin-like [Contarinia nasturtii]|uniref:chaoptin-like n=1 Tax=Contarinia nasturtii TaxID=265458 RepID=UPI0012D3EC89|nr:chaoptin-like [Contarinia nasturtii]
MYNYGGLAYEFKDCFYTDSDQSGIELICSNFHGIYFGSCYVSHTDAWGLYSGSFVKHLKTGDCRGIRLDENFPETFSNVETYDISNYGIESLTPNDFNLKQLKKLIASYNKLTNLEMSIFGHALQLDEIDFSFNKIVDISSASYELEIKLGTMNISHNLITNLKYEMFWSLGKLMILDSSDNLIETINKDAFRNNIWLDTLYLRNNPIRRIDCETLYWPIVHRTVDTVTVHISWDNIKEFDASNMSWENLATIYIRTEETIFQSGAIDDDAHIYIENDEMEVTHFNISGNDFADTAKVIDQLKASVESLDASYNFFADNSLNASTFQELHKLKNLNLSHAQLTHIDNDTFSNLRELRILDLSYNSMDVIDEHLFRQNTNLERLHVENSPIRLCGIASVLMSSVPVDTSNFKEIDASCFGHSLEIDISDSIIFRAPNFKFNFSREGFKQLTHFNISGNQLQSTADIINVLGESIKTLALQSNFMGKSNAQIFERLTNMEYLNLRDTNMTNMNSLESNETKNFADLHLEISRLDCNAFWFIQHSTEIHVSCEHIEEIDTSCLTNSMFSIDITYLDVGDEAYLDKISFTAFNASLSCYPSDLKIRYFNISGNHLPNTDDVN